MNQMARKYLEDAIALRRARDRHRRLGWRMSADSLNREAKSRIGLARMWHRRSDCKFDYDERDKLGN